MRQKQKDILKAKLFLSTLFLTRWDSTLYGRIDSLANLEYKDTSRVKSEC